MKIPRLTLRLRPNGRGMRIAVVAGVIPSVAVVVVLQVRPARMVTCYLPFCSVYARGPAFRLCDPARNHGRSGLVIGDGNHGSAASPPPKCLHIVTFVLFVVLCAIVFYHEEHEGHEVCV
jgi:hypothetical protein